MRPYTSAHRRLPAGFSLLEFMIAFALFLILVAGVFSEIGKFQKVYKVEETKVDASQESRTTLDEMAREVHQAGYPGQSILDPSRLANQFTVLNNRNVAAGLVRISNYELWFEGDVDGDGVVDVVHYMLMDSGGNPVGAGSTCPCTLQRSQMQKVPNTAPLAQPTVYTSSLSNVLNSAPAGFTLLGTTNGVANNILYNSYKNSPVFSPLDQTGTPIPNVAVPWALPIDITNPVAIASVKSIVITVNTLSLNIDMQTKAQVPITATVTAKLNN